ncbi:1041_t:CDS:2 [Paraglomus brasilianum]|uniref:1041_t:CDS:1 n=1 Tax=Paraglomus brasilianum TaxID=144538 RepID=A0A9N9D5M9_9GLOM|nr:1041_t:CDS:2 [Paraglomus brasilianum]
MSQEEKEKSRRSFLGVFNRSRHPRNDTLGREVDPTVSLLELPDCQAIINELQKAPNPNARAKIVQDLCGSVTKYTFNDMTDLWPSVRDLLGADMPTEARHSVFQLMISYIQEQSNDSSVLRAMFYDSIKNHNIREDFRIRIAALRELCNNGRNISPFEKNVGKMLAEWLIECINRMSSESTATTLGGSTITTTTISSDLPSQEATELQDILSLLINVVKFSFAQFEERDIVKLIENVAEVPKHSTNVSDVSSCLGFWDVVVRFGYVPEASVKLYVEVLCELINIEQLSQTTWHVMDNLLKGHCAYSAIRVLCNNLENATEIDSIRMLRGCVKLLGMAISGTSNEGIVSSMSSAALYSMRKAVGRRDIGLHHETLLQIVNILSRPDRNITCLEWEVVMDIMETTRYHVVDRGSTVETSTTTANDNEVEAIIATYSQLIFQIQSLHASSLFNGPTARFMSLIQDLHSRVSESSIIMLLKYYADEYSFYPSSPDWLILLVDVIKIFFINHSSSAVRQRVLAMTIDVYEATKDFYYEKVIEAAILPLLRELHKENDMTVFESAMDFLIDVIKESNDQWFSPFLRILVQCTECSCPQNLRQRYTHIDTCKAFISTIGIINVFQHTLYKDNTSLQVLEIFSEMLKILDNSSASVNSRLALLQCLLRLRVNRDHRIYILESLGSVSGATVLHRDSTVTAVFDRIFSAANDRMTNLSNIENQPIDSNLHRKTSWRQKITLSLLDRRVYKESKQPSEDSETSKPTDEQRLWNEPELLPFTVTANHPSPYVVSHDGTSTTNGTADNTVSDTITSNKIVIPIGNYLEILIKILANEKDWELYSYVLCHLSLQLSTKHLFCNAYPQILALRELLCVSITSNRLYESPPSGVEKANIYVVAYQILTMLIGYRSIFNRNQSDGLVLAFKAGLRRGSASAKPCIHALNICCFELASSMTRVLPETLNTLAQIITTTTMSVHILEFLCGLARLPQLYVNFIESDFKRVFGIAIQYIQHNKTGNDAQQVANPLAQYERIMAYQVIFAWFTALRLSERRKYVPFIVSGLLTADEKRSADKKTDDKNHEIDEQTETCFDMLARYAFANCDPKREKSFINELLKNCDKDKITSKTWLQGHAFVTMRTFKTLGCAEIIIRRPSGTVTFLTKLDNRSKFDDIEFVSLPETLMADNGLEETKIGLDIGSGLGIHSVTEDKLIVNSEGKSTSASIVDAAERSPATSEQSPAITNTSVESLTPDNQLSPRVTQHVRTQSDGSPLMTGESNSPIRRGIHARKTSADKRIYRKDDSNIDPSFLFLQLSPYPDLTPGTGLWLLPDDGPTERALNVLDRTPVVDFHKVSVVYVGKGQTTETEILANMRGSQNYIKFLNNLGNLVRLKNSKDVYVGGLDTRNDSDGEYAYYWKDDIIQLIFHCATLMPTNLENDPQCSSKKRHIGNNYVTIVYNDSDLDYAFNTIPSQVNSINIIISPHSENPIRPGTSPYVGINSQTTFFKVLMQRRHDMPEIGPISDFKMISGDALPAFVRQIAMHANIYAHIFRETSRGIEYLSHWRDRLRQIKNFKKRLMPAVSEPVIGTPGKGSAVNTRADDHVGEQVVGLEPVINFTRYT